MEITRDDNGNYDLKYLTPFQLQLIADALEVISPVDLDNANAAIEMAEQIQREIDRD